MKTNSTRTQTGSVLLIALLTITLLTMICATSLYITMQNTGAGMQTGSWQQALSGAEGGVDAAIRALNENGLSASNAWTNWNTVNSNVLPTSEPPSGTGSAASAPPTSSQYNYLPSSSLTLSTQGEGATSVKTWVTIDSVSTTFQDSGGYQWYRIRSTGQTVFPSNSVLTRVSNNRLDDILRNTMALRFNRKGGSNLGPSRTIEVIVKEAVHQGTSGTVGIVSKNTFTMGGSNGNFIDAFNSGNPFYSTNGQYVNSKHETDAEVGILNSTGSAINGANSWLYGSLAFNGPGVANAKQGKNVTGTISTPYVATMPTVSTPNWAPGTYSTVLPTSQGNTITITGDPNANPPTGTATNPLRYQVSSIVLSGHQTIQIASPKNAQNQSIPGYDNVQIWVTGTTTDSSGNSLSTTGNNAGIYLDSNANLQMYVQGNINVTGNGIVNGSGLANNLWLYGVTPSDGSNPTAYIAGNGNFIGVLEAPAYNTTFAGNGDVMGAAMANTLSFAGNGNFHYDHALDNKLPALNGAVTYSFASWFEDNSDPSRAITF